MAMPTSVTVEIEFTAGVWTDVTTYLDGQAGGSTRFGRTSPFGAPSPGTLSLTLDNSDGRFTPRRQTLTDGVTTHPYWPNVLPRKRIRVAWVVGGVPSYRFTGYVKGWPPSMTAGDAARVTISATTRDDRLARVLLRHLVSQEHDARTVAVGGSSALYLMNDPVDGGATGTQFVEASGVNPPLVSTLINPGFNSVSFASSSTPLPASDGLAGLSLVNGSAVSTARLSTSFTPDNFAASGWATVAILNSGNSAASSTAYQLAFYSLDQLSGVVLSVRYPATPSSALSVQLLATGSGTISATVNNDGQPHHYALTTVGSAGTQTLTLYIDGVAQGTTTYATGLNGAVVQLRPAAVASTDTSFQNLPVTCGPISYYWGGTYTSAIAVALNGAGRGFPGDTTDQRIGRFLAYAGLTSSDWTLDVGVATMGAQPVARQDVVSLCQAVAVTEGGGAAFYVGPDGKVQFRSRTYRKPGSPAMTVDAEADLDGGTFQPVFDDTQIVNQVQGARATADVTGTALVASDTTSQTAYGLTSNSFVSYASTDADALFNAQDQLAQQRNPAYQFGQVAVDLATATTAGLYTAAATVAIGSRLRVSNLAGTQAPTTRADVYVEGWADSFSTDGYTVVYDTSPADSPAWGLWDDTSYGRWQCDGGQTLNAGITNSATTLAIATTAGSPTFTTDPSMYPLTIQVGEENITLTSAPGGATSPQTFTGVTRGVNGTTAAAQTGGALVDLAPASTWTL